MESFAIRAALSLVAVNPANTDKNYCPYCTTVVTGPSLGVAILVVVVTTRTVIIGPVCWLTAYIVRWFRVNRASPINNK